MTIWEDMARGVVRLVFILISLVIGLLAILALLTLMLVSR